MIVNCPNSAFMDNSVLLRKGTFFEKGYRACKLMGRKLIKHEKHRAKGFYYCGAGNGTVAGGPATNWLQNWGCLPYLWYECMGIRLDLGVPSAPGAVGQINLGDRAA